MVSHASSLWFDSLSSISMGALLSEESLLGKSIMLYPSNDGRSKSQPAQLLADSLDAFFSNHLKNAEETTENRSGFQPSPVVADSLDAFFSNHLKNAPEEKSSKEELQPAHLVYDSFDASIAKYLRNAQECRPLSVPSSILDAEETCLPFAVKKPYSSKKEFLRDGRSYFAASSTQDPELKSNNRLKASEANDKQDGIAGHKPELDAQCFKGLMNDENSLGFSKINWTDSMGPFDLSISSQQMMKGYSISLSEFVRAEVLVNSIDRPEENGHEKEAYRLLASPLSTLLLQGASQRMFNLSPADIVDWECRPTSGGFADFLDGAERIGYLDDPYVLPCVGNDAYGPVPRGELALPLEAYDSISNEATFVQLRSPVLKGRMCDFAKNLADFAVATGKKHVVVLSGLDFGQWHNVDMSSGLQIHYLSSTTIDGADKNCENLGWKKLQGYNPSQRRWEYLTKIAEGNQLQEEDLNFDELGEDEDYNATLPFAALFSSFKAKGLKVTCLLCYCSEGDNIPDSIGLAEAACKLLGRSPSNLRGNEGSGWIIPLSWKTVYGPPPDMSMF